MSHLNLAKAGFVVLALAFGGLVVSQWVAAAPPERGSMSGRVLTTDGKPAAGVSLRVEKFEPRGAGPKDGGGSERGESALPDSGARGLTMLMGTKVIATTTTDQNGLFMFKSIEAGGFTLIGGNKKIGWVYQPVTVEANKETKLGDITLTKTD